MSKLQLHQSALNTLSMCGVKFERSVLMGEKIPPSARMVVGTAVDRAVRGDLQMKIDKGMLLTEPEVQDTARDALNAEWNCGVRIDEDDSEELVNSRGGAVDCAVDMAVHYHRAAAPAVKPTHVARKWVLDIEGLDIQLAGEIDVQEGVNSIRDTKTSAKSPVKDLADKSLQLTTYALAVKTLDGELPQRVFLDYVVRTPKRRDLKLVTLESSRTYWDITHLAERVKLTAQLVEKGVFAPAPVDSWWCSKKYCGYFDTCKFAARPHSVSIPAPQSDLVQILEKSLEEATHHV